MWQSYKDDANAMRCMMACPGWKPRIPMGRLARFKARLIGKLSKLFNLKGGINAK
jgi:hypothetical protein